MDSHNKPIAQRIEWLMEHARRHSETFTGSEAFLARQRYWRSRTLETIAAA